MVGKFRSLGTRHSGCHRHIVHADEDQDQVKGPRSDAAARGSRADDCRNASAALEHVDQGYITSMFSWPSIIYSVFERRIIETPRASAGYRSLIRCIPRFDQDTRPSRIGFNTPTLEDAVAVDHQDARTAVNSRCWPEDKSRRIPKPGGPGHESDSLW